MYLKLKERTEMGTIYFASTIILSVAFILIKKTEKVLDILS